MVVAIDAHNFPVYELLSKPVLQLLQVLLAQLLLAHLLELVEHIIVDDLHGELLYFPYIQFVSLLELVVRAQHLVYTQPDQQRPHTGIRVVQFHHGLEGALDVLDLVKAVTGRIRTRVYTLHDLSQGCVERVDVVDARVLLLCQTAQPQDEVVVVDAHQNVQLFNEEVLQPLDAGFQAIRVLLLVGDVIYIDG